MITLKHLRYFQALARFRHFGKAADACAVSQPALSMQIQELEHRLGGPLVERRRGDALLTPLGEEVARRAGAILLQVRDLSDIARHRSGALARDIVIGAIPSVAPYLLPTALPAIRQALPCLSVTLREALTSRLQEELLAGQLDMIVLALPVHHPDVVAMPLFQDPFILASPSCRTPDMGQQAGPVKADDVAQDDLLLLEEGHCFRDQAIAACGVNSRKRGSPARAHAPRSPFGASSLATLAQLVANDYGVTLLPMLALPVEVGDDPRIRLQPFTQPGPSRTIAAAWRRSSPRAEEFSEIARLLSAAALRSPGVLAA